MIWALDGAAAPRSRLSTFLLHWGMDRTLPLPLFFLLPFGSSNYGNDRYRPNFGALEQRANGRNGRRSPQDPFAGTGSSGALLGRCTTESTARSSTGSARSASSFRTAKKLMPSSKWRYLACFPWPPRRPTSSTVRQTLKSGCSSVSRFRT